MVKSRLPRLKHAGYLLLIIDVAVILYLIILIAQGTVSIGFSTIPVAILLGFLFIISYVFIKNPDTVKWDIPHLGTFRIDDNPGRNSASDADGFDRIAAIADEESTELADSLRAIRYEFDEASCEAIADTLITGIQARKTSPFYRTLRQLDSLLDARNFVEQSEDLEMQIVQREGERIYAKITEEHGSVKEGLEFDIYILDTINVDGDAETVSRQVGTAEVILVDDRVCGLEVVNWSDNFDPPRDKMGYIMNHSPTAKFDTEMIRNVDWDDIEAAHENLTQLATGGSRQDAN